MSAVVQSMKKIVGTEGSSTSQSFSSEPSAANMVWAGTVLYNSVTITAPTDNQTNTYSAGNAEQSIAGGFVRGRDYYAANISTGSPFTVTWNASGSAFLSCVAAEASGVVTSTPLDKVAANTGSGTAPSSGATAALAQADEICFGLMTHDDGDQVITEGATWTLLQESEGGDSDMPLGSEYKTVSATTAVTADWATGSSNCWLAMVSTFKDAGAPAGNAMPMAAHYYKMRGAA